jgi:hypothetical protein
MAVVWFILSLFYFGVCACLLGSSVLGLCRTAVSSGLITWLRRFVFAWFVSVALLVVFYGATLAVIAASSGWSELLRADGTEFLGYLACAVLLPFSLAIERWQQRFPVVLAVTLVSFLVYGRAFLIVSAGG